MKNNSAAIFIPARLDSSRLPKKILEPINGKPLIVNVLEIAKKSNIAECYVACCCEEVKKIVENYGGNAIVTDPNLQSGTDRVFAAVSSLEKKPEFIINLQGDIPVFEQSILEKTLKVLQENEDIDIATPAVFNTNLSDFNNKNIVKAIFNNMEKNQPGKAIYFSRSAIPNSADNFYSHIGIYAYRYNSIKKFVSLPTSYLEKIEKLEQLRALQNDMNIWVVPVNGIALSVDVKEDLDNVIKYLKNLKTE